VNTSTSSSAAPIRPLSTYLDLSKVSALPQKELEYIWRLRHAPDPLSLCAVIPTSTYRRICRTAKKHPQFILPLPRPNPAGTGGDVSPSSKDPSTGPCRAADVHFLQWGFHPPAEAPVPGSGTSNTHTSTVIFTNLASYQNHGTYARPHTAITHHLDLADSHGLVLLNGAITEGGGVTAEEGRWLLMCLQKFYDHGSHDEVVGKLSRQRLLGMFSAGDKAFSVEDLLDAAESFS
jgi:ATP synthase mitochondrial F1 complex assembly factor 1